MTTDVPTRQEEADAWAGKARLWAAVGAVTLAGAAIRLFQIGFESIWFDEALTRRWITRPTWGETLGIMAHGDHPPLYFAALRAWAALFSDRLVSLRAFSAVFSILTIPLFYLLGRLIVGRRSALFAAVLLAFSPYHLYYAQEARSYAFLVFWEVLLFWSLASVHRAALQGRSAPWAMRGAAWLAVCAMLYTHYWSLFVFLGALGLWVLAVWEKPRSKRVWTESGLWLALAVPAAVPCVWIVLQRAGTGKGAAWLKPLDAQGIAGVLVAFSYGAIITPRSIWVLILCAAGAFGLAGLSVWFLRSEARKERANRGQRRSVAAWDTLLTLLGATLVLPALISIKRPVMFYGQRYEIVATIPWILLLGAGLGRLWQRRMGKWAALAILAAILAGNGFYFDNYFNSRQKRAYDSVAGFLKERMRQDDAIVVVPEDSADCLLYYMPEGKTVLPPRPSAILGWAQGHPRSTLFWVSIREKADPAEAQIQSLFTRGPSGVSRVGGIPGMLLRVTAYAGSPAQTPGKGQTP